MGALRDDAAVPVGDVAVGAVAWRYQGTLRLSVVAKATFELAADAVMRRVTAAPIVGAEVHHGNSPMRSIRYTTDLIPYLTQADVLLTGHAYAPGGVPVEKMPVRLGVFDGARVLLDKTIIVQQPGGFTRMPLVFEHAYGGAGFRDNPLGVGVLVGSAAPNLVDPREPLRAAGFGPVGQDWSSRRKLRGSVPRSAFSAAVIELPHGFDWEYFQASLPDQRLEFLNGDEWIVMDGLNPTHPRLRTRLPGATGLGRIHGLSPWGIAEGQGLELHIDMLRIDADKQRCMLSFRGTFPLPNDTRVLAAVRVVAGVELPGEPIRWPELTLLTGEILDEGTEMLSEHDLLVVPDHALGGTMVLVAEEEGVPEETLPLPAAKPAATASTTITFDTAPSPDEAPLPFQPATGAASAAWLGSAQPASSRPRAAKPAESPLGSTTVDDEGPPASEPLPFQPPAPWVAGPVDAPPRGAAQGPGGTLVQELDDAAISALRRAPVAQGPGGTLVQELDDAAISALRRAPSAPRAEPQVVDDLESVTSLRVHHATIVQELDEKAIAELRAGLGLPFVATAPPAPPPPAWVEPEPEPIAEPPTEPIAAPALVAAPTPVPRAVPSQPYASEYAAEPAPRVPRPPAPRPVPGPAVRKGLYGRFGDKR